MRYALENALAVLGAMLLGAMIGTGGYFAFVAIKGIF